MAQSDESLDLASFAKCSRADGSRVRHRPPRADVDETSKQEVKSVLQQYDRSLLVSDPRRCEPKKCASVRLRDVSAVSYCQLGRERRTRPEDTFVGMHDAAARRTRAADVMRSCSL